MNDATGSGSDYAGDVTPEQAWAALSADPDAVLVDVRTAAEWRWVGVPDPGPLGRRLITAEWVGQDGRRNPGFLDELRRADVGPGSTVYFMCRSGARSAAAASAATAAGLGTAYNVSGGFEGVPDESGHRGTRDGWKVAGLPWSQG